MKGEGIMEKDKRKTAILIVELWRDFKAIFPEGDWEDFIRHLDLNYKRRK